MSSVPFVISVANQKGGVGKTTTSFTLAAKCHFAGMKTIFIDLDANAHATRILLEGEESALSSIDFLKGKKVEKCLNQTNYQNVQLIRSTAKLAEMEKMGIWKIGNLKTLHKRIKKMCLSLETEIVIIDTPSTVGTLQSNALLASDLVIAPSIPDYLSLSGFNNLARESYILSYRFKKKNIFRLLLTMINKESEAHKHAIEWIHEKLGQNIFKSQIPYDADFSDAMADGLSVFELPSSDTRTSAHSNTISYLKKS